MTKIEKLIGTGILYKHEFLYVCLFMFQLFNHSILIVDYTHDRGLYRSGLVAT
jgi:hypothetical protein